MLRITDYSYELPPDRIARYPLPERDAAKLLVYRKGVIEHAVFRSLNDYLPANTTLFFNDTKVIRARLLFRKSTGAEIEVFLLSPAGPSSEMALAMNAKETCMWYCSIGNLKRWKENTPLSATSGRITLTANLTNRADQRVTFSWQPGNLTLAEVIQTFGLVPLPPYLNRPAETVDTTRYQTVYSAHEGAVAAPTAGLHFTEQVLESLRKKNILTDFLTLHVSAGTFQPVKTEDALQHEMHNEQIVVTKKNILSLLQQNRLVIPVGTTAMRTLESLYWYGVKLLSNRKAAFSVSQSDPYLTYNKLPSSTEALQAIADLMNGSQADTLTGNTSIYIYPGYRFRICRGLITNFHLPASTLILLVAAFVGNDWRKIYDEAMKNDYRFLSYGDSSLLIP